MIAFFIRIKCKTLKHKPDWVYGEGVKVLFCYKCGLIHDVEKL